MCVAGCDRELSRARPGGEAYTARVVKKRSAVPTVPPVFAPVVAAFADDPEVTAGTMFSAGNVVLKARGKIFAMWADGALVVKLPRERVAELLGTGAAPFAPRPGRAMKQWVRVVARNRTWVALAREAHDFVVGQLSSRPRT